MENILGDVIDRGEHGIELLLRIRNMQNCTLLMGNLEDMMVNALRHPENLHFKYLWKNNRCVFTYDDYFSHPEEEQESLLCYLESLPVQLEIIVNRRKYILVHAAPQELYETENARCYKPKEFVMWHRLTPASVMPPRKTVIFGHTPTYKLRPQLYNAMRIYHGKCMIAIDCGCGFPHRGGQLGCIRLEDMTEYYSDDGIMTKEEVEEWMKRKDEFK